MLSADVPHSGPSVPHGDDDQHSEFERQRALLDELRQECAVLMSVIEHAPESCLASLDPDFNFLFVNSAYAEGCGFSKEELIGRNHFDLFSDEENEVIFRRARDTGERVEYRAKPFVFGNDPHRRVTYWDWTLTPLKRSDGQVESLVLALIDVTDRTVRERLFDALAELDTVLHSTLDTEEIIRRVIVGAVAASGCESVGVALRASPDWIGYFVDEPFGRLDRRRFTDGELPVAARAVERREPVWIDDVEADEEVRDRLRVLGLKSVLNVPLVVRDEAIGVLGFDHRTAAVPFTEPVVEFATRLAASLSLAIANARALEGERRKGKLDDALNRMLTVFITARNPDEVLREVVEESVRASGADYGVISVVETGEWVVTHAFGQGGEARVPVPYAYDLRPVIVRAAEMRTVQLVEDAMADPNTNKSIMREFGIGAFAAIPLVMRAELLGVLEIVYSDSPVVLDPVLADFFERLMFAAAVALEEAQESEREREVAETLQSALLMLPDRMEGIEFAHAYQAASDASRVGGDFYDLFELDNGLVGVTVGDISGKGLSAAALTSLVKNSIRARAVEKGTTPCDAVALADRVLYKGSAPEMFATVFFALLDRRDGRLVYCNAGHTAGVIAQPDGAALRLPANSPIAGALEGVAFRNSETRLEFGDALFLYTDGLVEARPGPGGELFGEDRLLEALSRRAVARETDLVEGVLGEVLEYSGGRLRDDVAVLEVRRTGDDSSAGTQTKLDLT